MMFNASLFLSKEYTTMANNKHLQALYSRDYPLSVEAEHISSAITAILLGIEDGEGVSEERWAQLLGHAAIMRSHLDVIERAALKAMTQTDLRWQTPEV